MSTVEQYVPSLNPNTQKHAATIRRSRRWWDRWRQEGRSASCGHGQGAQLSAVKALSPLRRKRSVRSRKVKRRIHTPTSGHRQLKSRKRKPTSGHRQRPELLVVRIEDSRRREAKIKLKPNASHACKTIGFPLVLSTSALFMFFWKMKILTALGLQAHYRKIRKMPKG